MDGNEGQIFSAEIGWYSAIAPHVMTILVLVVAGVFFVFRDAIAMKSVLDGLSFSLRLREKGDRSPLGVRRGEE